jgi:hypothetical protein
MRTLNTVPIPGMVTILHSVAYMLVRALPEGGLEMSVAFKIKRPPRRTCVRTSFQVYL